MNTAQPSAALSAAASAAPSAATSAPPSTAPAAPPARLFFVDWLRIGAFALLVLYHVGMLYVPWDFHVKQSAIQPSLPPWMWLTNPWRMSLLFVVSGLATGLMLGRAGLAAGAAPGGPGQELRRLWGQRSLRLLLPLMLGMLVIVPPQAYFQVREQFGYGGDYVEFLRLYLSGYHGFCKPQGGCLQLPTWNHLWFLPYLWCYTALLLLALWLLPAAWVTATADRLARLRGVALLVVPALLLGLIRAALIPHFPETHALLDDLLAHATYGPLFLLGVLLARRQQLLQALQALRWPALLLAVAGWLLLCLGWTLFGSTAAAPPFWRTLLRFAFAAEQWGALVAAFGFAQRHLNHDHRWRAALAEAVFPLYLLHQTVIIASAVWLRPLALPAGAEAATITVLAFGLSLLGWRVARRLPWLRPWMGLSRQPRPGQARHAPANTAGVRRVG